MNSASVSSSTLSERAARVHAYVAQKHPSFSLESAECFVADLEPHRFEPIKVLARRVRAALAAKSVEIGHESSLQATARLQGYSDFFHVPHGPDTLEIAIFEADAAPPFSSPDWRSCANALGHACDRWLESHPSSRLLRLEVTPNFLAVYGVVSDQGREACGISNPIAVVRPLVGGTWLEGAASALESLRRRIEEAHRATLDGLALVRYCSTRDKDALPYCPWGPMQAADAPYSELVLMREDQDLASGFEIARGDEVSCWQQLLGALKGYPPGDIRVDDVGAWLCGDARYAWEVATLRPHEVVPGLAHSNLPTDESRHLLRRFQAALRGGNLQQLRDAVRRRGGIDEPPTHCRLDAHRVLRALNKRNETWENFCTQIGLDPRVPTKQVEFGDFLRLAEHLEHADPASLLQRPTRSELSAVLDDQLLRTLMPRVNHVRYRVPAGLQVSQRRAVDEAVQEFATSIAIRNGALPLDAALPDVVYAGDGEELRLTLENLGMVMFVGLMPYLKPIPEDVRSRFPRLGRYAFGTSLFVDIDVAA